MKTVDAGTGEEVSRGDLVKGFEIAKGEYVLFAKEELDAVKLESTRIIDIEKFVPRASIDRLYWDTPYHLVPMGKTGIEAYAVIRAAMAKQNKLAIGRLVMSTRERVCAIEIEEGGLVLNTLRTAEEVRGLDAIGSPDLPKPDPQMLQIAEKIVEQQSGEFDPSEFRDRYEDALRALIEQKRKGKPVKPSARPANDDTKVIDLMAALKKSLGAGAERRPAGSKPARQQEETERPEGGMMGTQLPLPARWAFAGQSRRDPRDRLDALRRDATGDQGGDPRGARCPGQPPRHRAQGYRVRHGQRRRHAGRRDLHRGARPRARDRRRGARLASPIKSLRRSRPCAISLSMTTRSRRAPDRSMAAPRPWTILFTASAWSMAERRSDRATPCVVGESG